MAIIDILQTQAVPVRNALIPDEGPKAIPLTLDFSAANTYRIDYSNLQQRGFLSILQTLYIDNSGSSVALTITVERTGQVIIVKPATQGYFPVLSPNPIILSFTCVSGPAGTKVFLLNFPVAPGSWATA